MKYLVIIPALNEESSIVDVIQALHAEGVKDILVINDCSTDQTAELVSGTHAEIINLPLPLGAWGATQTGIRYARKNNYDYVITMDADGQHLSNGIKLLNSAIKKDHSNVVIGTCTQRLSKPKKVAWWFFKMISKLKIEDLTSGFRIYDKKAMKTLTSTSASLLDYQDVGVLMLLVNSGLKISETQVCMAKRKNGRSKIFYSWWMVMKYMIQTTTLCIAKIGNNNKGKSF